MDDRPTSPSDVRPTFTQNTAASHSPLRASSNRIKLNVGGTLFVTTRATLLRDQNSMLAAMFSGRYGVEEDGDGSCFIDRDGGVFRYVLNYLRDGSDAVLPADESTLRMLLREAQYYNMEELYEMAAEELRASAPIEEKSCPPVPELTRKDIVLLIAQNQKTQSDGVRLSLEGLNLRTINLSHLGLENVSFEKCDLEEANFSNAKLSESCLVGANCTKANFSDAILSGADMQKSRICGADFTACSLDRVDLSEVEFDKTCIFTNAELQYTHMSTELRDHAIANGAIQ